MFIIQKKKERERLIFASKFVLEEIEKMKFHQAFGSKENLTVFSFLLRGNIHCLYFYAFNSMQPMYIRSKSVRKFCLNRSPSIPVMEAIVNKKKMEWQKPTSEKNFFFLFSCFSNPNLRGFFSKLKKKKIWLLFI